MWLIRWIVFIFFFLLILLFALQNQSQEVAVRLLNWQSPTLPLYLIVYLAFAAGIVFWLLFSAGVILRLKGRMRRLQKEDGKIREELNRLRNAAIEEELEPAESAEGE
jgi:uncharacterized integral membrane protein